MMGSLTQQQQSAKKALDALEKAVKAMDSANEADAELQDAIKELNSSGGVTDEQLLEFIRFHMKLKAAIKAAEKVFA